MNSKTVPAIQGGKTKIAPFKSILMSRITIDRTQASPGYEAAQARSRPIPAPMRPISAPFDKEDELKVAVVGPDGFHDADLARSLQDAHQHRIGDPQRRDEQSHAGDACHPAEDQKINESLALDELDGRPASRGPAPRPA